MPYLTKAQAMRLAAKKAGKKQGRSAEHYKLPLKGSAEDSKPPNRVSGKFPDVSADEEPGTSSLAYEDLASGTPGTPSDSVKEPVISTQAHHLRPDLVPPANSSPAKDASSINPEMPVSKNEEGEKSGDEGRNPECGANSGGKSGGLSEQSAASLYMKDSATAGGDKKGSISFLVEIKAKLVRDKKAMRALSKIGKTADDSNEEASTDPAADVTEWVEGEKDGYHFRIPKKIWEEGEKMSYIELLKDIRKRADRIAEKLQRKKKAMAAMNRWSKWQEEEAEFVPPAWFFSEPEADSAST